MSEMNDEKRNLERGIGTVIIGIIIVGVILFFGGYLGFIPTTGDPLAGQ